MVFMSFHGNTDLSEEKKVHFPALKIYFQMYSDLIGYEKKYKKKKTLSVWLHEGFKSLLGCQQSEFKRDF